MRAVLYRVRSVVRSRMLATLSVTMIVAVVCGAVIAFAAGAPRTSTAPDRYTASFGGAFDALVRQGDFGRPMDREVAALPGIASAGATSQSCAHWVPIAAGSLERCIGRHRC